ncbi:MAG: hypothetical protein ABF289_06005 [Clostridiales bacterium]
MNLKSILFGIGLGIIFTSLISIIYSKDDSYNVKMNQDILKDTKNNYDGFVISGDQDNSVKKFDNEELKKVVDKKESKKFILITINEGDSSKIVGKKLYDKGIIIDSEKFENEMISLNKTRDIKIGDYSFEKNEEISNIIKKITENK